MSLKATTEHVRWREILNRQYAAPLLLVCLGVWLHAADSLIVATMMPAIISEIGGEAYVPWTIALYEIGSIVAGAASGLVALRLGLRRPMIIASSVFSLGCFVSAGASNMALLLSGRLLQGLGGGGLTAMAFVSLSVLFPTRLAARAMAMISVLWGSSAFLGPLIGGLFVSYSSWRYGFVFFGAQAIFLALFILFVVKINEADRSKEPAGNLPLGRLFLLSFGVLFIAYAGIVVTPLRTPLLLVLGLGLLATFLRIDAKFPASRLLPKNPFGFRSTVGAALTGILLMNMGVMGLSTYGPLMMTAIHGTPAIVAGYVLAAISFGWSITAFVVSGAPERHDPYYIGGGMLLVTISVAGLIYAVPSGPIGLIAAFSALEGVGYGASYTFIIRRTKRFASPEDVERLSAAIPTVSRLGYALGASVTGILANAAGFSLSGNASDTAHVARVIFTGSLPIALLGLFAMVAFATMKAK
ncbi:MAG: MFS family permease [Paracoccaceae bacterium]|jgi:MFS family permease